jgi:hypothetical protein
MQLAQYAEDSPNRLDFDKTAEPVLRQPARFGDPWNLAQSGGGRNVGADVARRALREHKLASF